MPFAKTKLINRAHLWELAKVHKEFTAHDLSVAEKCSTQTVFNALKDWKRWGYVAEAGLRGNRKLFRITKKAGIPPVGDLNSDVMKVTTPQESMWFVIRKAGVFDFRDIAMQANNESVAVTEDDARDFCRMLANAGYLRVEKKADGKGRLARYRLINDTGPKPPRACRVRAVYDANKSAFTYIAGGLK